MSDICPVVYTITPTSHFDLDTTSTPKRITLKLGFVDTPGTYEVTLEGKADKNPN